MPPRHHNYRQPQTMSILPGGCLATIMRIPILCPVVGKMAHQVWPHPRPGDRLRSPPILVSAPSNPYPLAAGCVSDAEICVPAYVLRAIRHTWCGPTDEDAGIGARGIVPAQIIHHPLARHQASLTPLSPSPVRPRMQLGVVGDAAEGLSRRSMLIVDDSLTPAWAAFTDNVYVHGSEAQGHPALLLST
jgi:hypothetical protein